MSVCNGCRKWATCFLPCGLLSKERGSPEPEFKCVNCGIEDMLYNSFCLREGEKGRGECTTLHPCKLICADCASKIIVGRVIKQIGKGRYLVVLT